MSGEPIWLGKLFCGARKEEKRRASRGGKDGGEERRKRTSARSGENSVDMAREERADSGLTTKRGRRGFKGERGYTKYGVLRIFNWGKMGKKKNRGVPDFNQYRWGTGGKGST